MKCFRRVSLALLLIFVVNSLAFCGWDAFKKPSEEVLTGGSVQETVIEQPTMSLPEVENIETEIEKASRNCSESSATYDENLAAVSEAVEAVVDALPEESEEVVNAKAVVEDLVVSKAKLDEDYDILDGLVKQLSKEHAKAVKKTEGINFGIGLSLGYKPMTIVSPGITFQMRSGDWTFRTDINYDMDTTGSKESLLRAENLEVRLGVIWEP